MPVAELEHLSPADRALARGVRNAARIVGAAALPAEFRGAAFARLLELELEQLRAAERERGGVPASA